MSTENNHVFQQWVCVCFCVCLNFASSFVITFTAFRCSNNMNIYMCVCVCVCVCVYIYICVCVCVCVCVYIYIYIYIYNDKLVFVILRYRWISGLSGCKAEYIYLCVPFCTSVYQRRLECLFVLLLLWNRVMEILYAFIVSWPCLYRCHIRTVRLSVSIQCHAFIVACYQTVSCRKSSPGRHVVLHVPGAGYRASCRIFMKFDVQFMYNQLSRTLRFVKTGQMAVHFRAKMNFFARISHFYWPLVVKFVLADLRNAVEQLWLSVWQICVMLLSSCDFRCGRSV